MGSYQMLPILTRSPRVAFAGTAASQDSQRAQEACDGAGGLPSVAEVGALSSVVPLSFVHCLMELK